MGCSIDKHGKVGERKLTECLVRNGQALLPMDSVETGERKTGNGARYHAG